MGHWNDFIPKTTIYHLIRGDGEGWNIMIRSNY
jgi:hypothetical protein